MKFLTAEEYAQLGLKCGMEIHQQLLTFSKQFCRCPARRYSNKYDAEILRHMRPTLSELGEYDGTALMEFKKKKEIVYRLNRESVCTYEMDDTPPFLVNEEGLDIAIEIALLLNCHIVDELHIARKQYLDGSIPTGFQRTAIVGLEGWVPYKDRKIRIIQFSYEEDSCRQISDVGHTISFNTDRLGMPLVETVTYPDMKTPWEAAEVVRLIARIARVTGKVRRGSGSAREDVNVSIEGGTRIEIKGVSKIGCIPGLVHVEALRQKALLNIRQELLRRGIAADTLKTVDKDVTDLLKDSRLEHFQRAIGKGHRIRGIKLCELSGILNYPTQPDIHFDRELAGRVRVVACLDEQPIIFHTDNYRLYEGSREDLKKLRRAFKSREGDVIVLLWGPEEDTVTGVNEIRLRILDAIRGVPSETRQAFPDGTTDFERILPGPDRMYPDTDLPPTRLTEERISRIKASLPKLPWEREAQYQMHGVGKDTASLLAISRYANLLDRVEKLPIALNLVAFTLTQILKALRRSGVDVERLSDDRLFDIFRFFAEGRFHREILPHILRQAAAAPEMTIAEILKKEDIRIFSEAERDEIIAEALRLTPEFIPKRDKRARLVKFYTGQAMKRLRGRNSPQEVKALIEAKLPEGT